jgi:hypothetical protein
VYVRAQVDDEHVGRVQRRTSSAEVYDAIFVGDVAFEHKSNDNGNFLTRLLMGGTRVLFAAGGGDTGNWRHTVKGVLALLGRLHALVTDNTYATTTAAQLAMEAFVSSKLTHKLRAQLCDPLCVAANALPAWCDVLMERCAWLFTLATRQQYIEATAFGTSRAIVWLQTQRDSGKGRSDTLDLFNWLLLCFRWCSVT